MIFFILAGIITVFIDRPYFYLGWVLLLGVVFLIGIYDFYLWEYDYGHNLDPNAPMKFDDASFQPPLIGRKEIINFTAISMPHLGGYLAFGSLLFAFFAFVIKRKLIKTK